MWNPKTLEHCLDSLFLADAVGILAVGMLLWYVAIATIWWKSSMNASPEAKSVWHLLVLIFIVCACAGYLPMILALFVPKFAAVLRIAALIAQNIICPVFWFSAKAYNFKLYGRHQKIGEEFMKVDPDKLGDAELISHVREVIKMAKTSTV